MQGGIRFEDTWLEYPESYSIVERVWAQRTGGSAACRLARKCFRALGELRKWHGNKISILTSTKAELEGKIRPLQELDAGEVGINHVELATLLNLLSGLNKVERQIASWWKQRAKVRWLEDGDRNSAFFHMAATSRRRSNRILSLEADDGSICSEPQEVMHILTSFFSQKWRTRGIEAEDFPVFHADQLLSDGQRADLVRSVSELEVREAVFSMGRRRSPGVDGITGSFFHGFWRTVGKDVCDAVMQFFHSGVMPSRWKQTLVVLIPKREPACRPIDFRPISLCTTIYKVVAKILVNRLKPVLPQIVSQEQGAFVPGRLISDNVLLAQEAINRVRTHTSPSGSMALKIDMEQAYDRMEWKCLELTMQRLGFPDRWIAWVMACITNPMFSITANGNRSQWVSAECGFRQGCPLSPYLFILCSELLSTAFRRHAADPDPLGIRCSPGGPLLSHLLYADDVLVLAKAEDSACRRVKKIFEDYSRWTGQTINMAKCGVMFSKRVPAWKSRRISGCLGFQKVTEITYLGIPLRLRALVSSDFDRMLQQVNSRLHGWGVRHLSLAGRLALINSTLLLGPVYLLSHCCVPASVISLVEKAARKFLWQGSDGHGMHYIAWDKVCTPKAHGGLGVHGLKQWRPALLARHSLRFLNAGGSLLNDCVTARYGLRLCHNVFRKADSPTWKLLCWGYVGLARGLTWEVGDGARISGNGDRWINGRSLHSWPTFINIDHDFPDDISALISSNGTWEVDKLRLLCGGPLAECIAGVPIRGAGDGDLPSLACRFSGRSATSFIYNLNWEGEVWEHSWIWKLKLRPKEEMFWWRVCNDAIPTFAWLHRRGLHEELACPWGCDEHEDTTHILINCLFLRQVVGFLQAWGFSFPRLLSLSCLYDWLRKCVVGRNHDMQGTLYCSVVYHCWMNRLAKVHNRSYASPMVAATSFIGNISCGSSSSLRFWDTTGRPAGINPQHWCPPPYGWLKANFDGALLPNGQGGFAMVIRDHRGRLVAAAGTPIVHWDPGAVELLGFMLIKDILQQGTLEAAGFVLEGDNVNVINYIKNMHGAARLGSRATEHTNFSFLLNMHNVIIKHVYRESNRCADCAAKFAMHSPFLWSAESMTPPSFCSLLNQEKAFCN